jgi:hypothetical protein
MLKISPDAILAAQIVTVDRINLRYTAMVSVGNDARGAAQAESFQTPKEALTWLREKLAARADELDQIENRS